jgi:hypothetical protein
LNDKAARCLGREFDGGTPAVNYFGVEVAASTTLEVGLPDFLPNCTATTGSPVVLQERDEAWAP